MNVKLQGLLNAARWVDQTYGPATLTDVRARCSPAVCERLDSGIANTWHPFAEFVEFLTATEEALGHRDGRIA